MTDSTLPATAKIRTQAAQARAAVVSELIAGALVAFGLVCWIAANWSGLHRFTKLELVAGALLLSAAGAAVLSRLRVPGLLLGVMATGGLLALLGQTYPSGADAWQLFAWWAVLAVSFALAARSDAVWSLWSIVATAAIILWRFQERGNGTADWSIPWLLSGALAALLWPAASLERWRGASRWAFRVAVVSLIGLVTGEAVVGFLDNRNAVTAESLAVLAGTAVILSRMRPLDLGLLAINALAIDLLIVWRVAVSLTPHGAEPDTVLVIGLFAAFVIGASVMILRRISSGVAPTAVTASGTGTDSASHSWPLVMLSGFGALIAAAPLVAFYWLAFEAIIREAGGAAMLGVATLAAAVLILRGGAQLGFRQMFGIIAAVVGLILIGQAAIEVSEKNAGFMLCATLAGTAVVVPARWARTIFGFAAAIALSFSIYAHSGRQIEYAHLATMLVVAASAGALCATRRSATASEIEPFLSGWLTATLLVLMALAGRPFLIGAGLTGILDELFRSAPIQAVTALSMALAVAAAALVFGIAPRWRGAPGFALAAAGLVLTWFSPFLGPALFVFACAFVSRARVLATAAALAILWIVSAAYYALNWTLTEKAGTMIGLGLFLGVVGLLARRNVGAGSRLRPSAPPALAGLLIATGIVLTGGIAGTAVVGAENVIRHGRQIFVALRPVDPRSMMQGDYMAIAFDTARLPQPEPGNRIVRAFATPDNRSVASLSLQPPEGGDAIAVELRTKSRRWFVGSDAWFFEEGLAKTFEAAKFGIFRVGPDGRLLLVGLADKDLTPLLDASLSAIRRCAAPCARSPIGAAIAAMEAAGS